MKTLIAIAVTLVSVVVASSFMCSCSNSANTPTGVSVPNAAYVYDKHALEAYNKGMLEGRFPMGFDEEGRLFKRGQQMRAIQLAERGGIVIPSGHFKIEYQAEGLVPVRVMVDGKTYAVKDSDLTVDEKRNIVSTRQLRKEMEGT